MLFLTRRALIAVPALVLSTAAGAQGMSSSSSERFEAAERSLLKGRQPLAGKVMIDMPPLSENGNSIELSIRVESPMTRDDHVAAIHVLAQKNPFPHVATFTLTPRSGRAEVATRIRAGESQSIIVVAETSQGLVYRATRDVIVILGACVSGG
ncbi:MAG: thiosulfate oxidation carrier protein SoxY [Bosea sp. (in: a-proteobacteria)]